MTDSTAPTPPSADSGDSARECTARHLRFGWWMLLLFLTLGIVLESLHGFKVGFYLDVSNDTRRHMWTLGHAHGTLIALINVVFAVTVSLRPRWGGVTRQIASRCLIGASILMPGGFLLGGAVIYAGDPGLGIFLLPIGAGLLFAAVLLTARGVATN